MLIFDINVCVCKRKLMSVSLSIFLHAKICVRVDRQSGVLAFSPIYVCVFEVSISKILVKVVFFEYSFAIYGFSLAFSHFLYRYSPLCWWVLISIRLVGRSFDRILFLLLLLPLFATYPRWIRHQFSIYLSISFFNFVSSICQVS